MGALAALFVASSPIVIFRSLWPMTDVPAAALWTAAAVVALRDSRISALGAGTLAGVAVLVRPNLVFIPPAFAAYLVLASSTRRDGLVRAAVFCSALAPAVLAIAALNHLWYGGALRSGYGTSDLLYSLNAVWPNLQRYPAWLIRSHSALVLLFLVPLAYVRGGAGVDRRALLLSYLLIGATWLCYLAYFPFEEWWYLRFLLPAIPATLVLVALALRGCARAVPDPWGPLLAMVLAAAMLTAEVRFTNWPQMLGLREGEDRYVEAGLLVKNALPANAIVLAIQHSGSVRFYSARPTIRFDLIDEAWVARTGDALIDAGYRPYAVFEDWELPQVRGRLGLRPEEPLPWRLIARLQKPVGVNVFALAPGDNAAGPIALIVATNRGSIAPAGY